MSVDNAGDRSGVVRVFISAGNVLTLVGETFARGSRGSGDTRSATMTSTTPPRVGTYVALLLLFPPKTETTRTAGRNDRSVLSPFTARHGRTRAGPIVAAADVGLVRLLPTVHFDFSIGVTLFYSNE